MLLLVLLLAPAALGFVSEHKVTNLPGFGPPLSDTYSGLLEISPGLHYFYFFTTALEGGEDAPVSSWYNGGPGCDSLMGQFQENGIYSIPDSSGGIAARRDTAWARRSHMLYYSQPAAVGMSYQEGVKVVSTDDMQTAERNALFLQAFFAAYPSMANGRPFYITGESYAGTYIPTMVRHILMHPSLAIPKIHGIFLGNPCTDSVVDHNAYFTMVKDNGIISPLLASQIEAECPPAGRYILDNSCCQFNQTMPAQSTACVGLLKDMYRLAFRINLYDIFGKCVGPVDSEEPCSSTGNLPGYLDRPEVREALHAPPLSVTGPWAACSPNLNYTSNFHSIATQVWPDVLRLAPDMRVVIYSGTGDSCVPWMGTEQWTRQLHPGPAHKPWNSWFVDSQVAGYHVAYTPTFSFVTFKGQAHEVPMTAPQWAFAGWEKFLNNTF